MHGRGRITINPRIPTMPGRSMSAFHRPGRHCLHQARSAVRCPASRVKGELHPTKKRVWGGFSCKTDGSVNGSIHYLVWPLPMGLLCNCFVGVLPYTRYVIRSFPLCGVKVQGRGRWGGQAAIKNYTWYICTKIATYHGVWESSRAAHRK